MKAFSRVLTAGIVLALLVMPLAAIAGQMLVPMEKKIAAGTTVVDYAGQSLRFTTPIALVAKFDPVSDVNFRLTVHAYGTPPAASGSSSSGLEFELFWEDFQKQVYNGPPPPSNDPFSEVFLSESGFTEK